MAQVHCPVARDAEESALKTIRHLRDPDDIRGFLKPYGIWYECWDVAGRIGPDATNEDILAAYAPEIERLKAAGGYQAADVIDVGPETPNLDAMLAKFSEEHTHDDDEVRFIVEGRGIFHINPGDQGPVFSIETEAGDLINVPAGCRHWFDLCEEKRIRAIRLFVDPSGWTPHYTQSGIDQNHAPVCWGPAYFTPQLRVDPLA